jgi:hypothetical protein
VASWHPASRGRFPNHRFEPSRGRGRPRGVSLSWPSQTARSYCH